MTSSSPSEAPTAPPPPKPNSFARIGGVLFAPTETFASIAQRPDWVVPLVLWMLVSLAGGVILAQKVDFGATVRQSMEDRKDVPPDTAERSVRMAGAMGKVFSYSAPAPVGATTTTAPNVGTMFIYIKDDAGFQPSKLTVKPGTTVTWLNLGQQAHCSRHERLAVELHQGLVPAHPSARSAGEHHPGHAADAHTVTVPAGARRRSAESC